MDKDKVTIAKIIAAHGIKGEVKLFYYTEKPESLTKLGALFDAEGNEIKIKISSIKDNIVIARIENVTSRNQAELLKNQYIFALKNNFPKLSNDEFYYEDLVGCMVIHHETGAIIGRVIAIQNYGAGDIIEIALPETNSTEMVSFDNEYIKEIDLNQKIIRIIPPDYV